MKKKTFAVLLSATLVTSSTVTVFAKDITVTVPDYGFGEEDTSKMPESKETTVNDDGSTTYTLTTKQQKKWKKTVKSNFDDYVKDILDSLNHSVVFQPPVHNTQINKPIAQPLTAKTLAVESSHPELYQHISYTPISLDDLSAALNLPVDLLLVQLLDLELQDLIVNENGLYKRIA